MSYLTTQTESFANLTHHVHEDEAAALAHVNARLADEPTWAVVVLHEAEPGHVDYTLRMNYSVLPSTYDLVRRRRHRTCQRVLACATHVVCGTHDISKQLANRGPASVLVGLL